MRKYSEKRPWGKFEQYTKNEICTVKILTILPGQKLSLQKHLNRSEFWKILKGRPIITIDKKTIKAKEGEEFFIPKKTIHRIGAGSLEAQFLEISFGKFDEKDEIRIEDKYERIL